MSEIVTTPTVAERIVDHLVQALDGDLAPLGVTVERRSTPASPAGRPTAHVLDTGDPEPDPEDLPAETHSDTYRRRVEVEIYVHCQDDEAAYRQGERLRALAGRALRRDATAGGWACDVTIADTEIRPDNDPDTAGYAGVRLGVSVLYATAEGDEFTLAG